MTDREAPTPRQTGQWQLYTSAAQELGAELRSAELRLSKVGPDMNGRRADLFRHTRAIVEKFAMGFAEWAPMAKTDAPISTAQKAREQREFIELARFARTLLQKDDA